MKTLEVCVDSLQSAINAEAGGADRVELCANLNEGGTTPSAGMIGAVRTELSVPIHVMIRPRGGDFLYSKRELEVMKQDIEVAKKLRVNGLVFGCLTADGEVDIRSMRSLMECSETMNVTFHRAFDMVKDPFGALEDLVGLGVDRILTSGLENTAPEGASMISSLVKRAGDKIAVMAGGGIRPYNIRELIEKTGVKECHVSARKETKSGMNFRNEKVSMGGIPGISEYSVSVVDGEMVELFLMIINKA